MDSLLPVRRWAIKSCHEENSVHQFRGTGDEEMLLTAVFILLSKSDLIMLRGPTSSRSSEMKKLEYGVKKCHKMHIGPKTIVCEDIKVHNEIGSKVEMDKYVGDIISKDGTNLEKNKGKM